MSQLSPLLAALEVPQCQLHMKKKTSVLEAYFRKLSDTCDGYKKSSNANIAASLLSGRILQQNMPSLSTN